MRRFAWLLEWMDIETYLLERALARCASASKGVLVDVGCGEKPYKALFAPFVTRYIGVEKAGVWSGQVLAEAPDLLQTGDRIPVDDAASDTVLCLQVLEHTEDPPALLKEIHRILRPEGRLILSTPFSFRYHMRPNDFYRFTDYGLRHLLSRHHFEVERVCPRGGFWAVIGQKLASYCYCRLGRFEGLTSGKSFEYELKRPRLWLLPIIGPLIAGIAAAALLLDKLFHYQDETLGHVVLARKKNGLSAA